jgi:hypothetical protein
MIHSIERTAAVALLIVKRVIINKYIFIFNKFSERKERGNYFY